MKTDTVTERNPREIALYVLAYLLWLATAIMSIVAVLQIRLVVNAMFVIGGVDTYTLGVINQVCLLLVGFAAFVYVIYLEHFYREAITLRLNPKRADESLAAARMTPKGRIGQWLSGLGIDILLRRFAWTFAIPMCLFLITWVLVEITLRAMETV